MPQLERVGSLEINQDLDFQRREWRLQWVAWGVVLLILVAGLAGLLGGGPLSNGQASAGPLAVNYERFVRKQAPARLELMVSPEAAVDGEVALWIGDGFLEKVNVAGVIPEPVAMEASP
jgi:hypothetical protein